MTWNDHGITIIFGEYHSDLSYLVVLIILASVATVVLLVFLSTKFFGSKNRQRCRWKRVPGRNRPPFTRWRCKVCFVEAYSTDKKPPKECKKILKVVP